MTDYKRDSIQKLNTVKMIRETGLIRDGFRVAAGVSGGADSVFLFYVLLALKRETDFDLRVVHVDHSIRGDEAARDADFVQRMCEDSGVPFTLVRRDIPAIAKARGLTLEEAGRIERRKALEEAADEMGGGLIALAHHMDDLAETVLFRAFRGTGIGGLCAMSQRDGRYIRPLLCIRRSEIEEALKTEGIPWVTDSTNLERDAVRNRIRLDIIPMAEEAVNPSLVEHLASLASIAGETEDFIKNETEKRLGNHLLMLGEGEREPIMPGSGLAKGSAVMSVSGPAKGSAVMSGSGLVKGSAVMPERGPGKERPVMLLHSLTKEHPLMRKELTKAAIALAGGTLKDVGAVHILSVTSLFEKEEGAMAHLPCGLRAARVRDGVVVVRCDGDESDEALAKELDKLCPGCSKSPLADLKIIAEEVDEWPFPPPENEYTKWVDYDKISGIPAIRTRRAGDYIVINALGQKKKLSDHFTDMKVPKSSRDRIPIIADGSEVIWVAGMRLGYSFRLDGSTKRVLRLRAVKEGGDDGTGYQGNDPAGGC